MLLKINILIYSNSQNAHPTFIFIIAFKGNHSEILTLVSLTTDPPQVCLGSGSTTDASHNRVL